MSDREGIVVRSHGGHYYVDTGNEVVDCTMRGRVKQRRGESDLIAVGDRVRWSPIEEGGGIIEEVLPRHAVLSRTPPPPRAPIEQVIVANLINAAEALGDRQDGIIEVTTSRDKEATRVTVCIADNGPGMTEEVKNRLFDPFFTTKQKTGGMGLGLSVAYGIIKDHQGWIDVDTKLGEGTTLQYHFPAARSKA